MPLAFNPGALPRYEPTSDAIARCRSLDHPMVRLVNRSDRADDSGPGSRPRPFRMLENPMIGRLGTRRDPFEGQGAIRTRLRLRIEGVLALGLAIVACGMTTAVWLRSMAPLADRLGLH